MHTHREESTGGNAMASSYGNGEKTVKMVSETGLKYNFPILKELNRKRRR